MEIACLYMTWGDFFLTQALQLPWQRFIQISSKLLDVLFAVWFQSFVIGQRRWLTVGKWSIIHAQEICIFLEFFLSRERKYKPTLESSRVLNTL